MIFVTVSTGAFDRLVKEMDKIAPLLKEKVVMQIGNTSFEPKNAEFFRFAPRKRMLELIKEASLVVTHAGCGNIIMALDNNKPCVIVPRRKKFGEQIDDHQMQIAEGFKKRKGVAVVYETEQLLAAIKKFRRERLVKRKGKLIKVIEQYLNELEWQKRKL